MVGRIHTLCFRSVETSARCSHLWYTIITSNRCNVREIALGSHSKTDSLHCCEKEDYQRNAHFRPTQLRWSLWLSSYSSQFGICTMDLRRLSAVAAASNLATSLHPNNRSPRMRPCSSHSVTAKTLNIGKEGLQILYSLSIHPSPSNQKQTNSAGSWTLHSNLRLNVNGKIEILQEIVPMHWNSRATDCL